MYSTPPAQFSYCCLKKINIEMLYIYSVRAGVRVIINVVHMLVFGHVSSVFVANRFIFSEKCFGKTECTGAKSWMFH